jgi:hypothetical protein
MANGHAYVPAQSVTHVLGAQAAQSPYFATPSPGALCAGLMVITSKNGNPHQFGARVPLPILQQVGA